MLFGLFWEKRGDKYLGGIWVFKVFGCSYLIVTTKSSFMSDKQTLRKIFVTIYKLLQ